jgi:hypothetical protein
LREVSPERDFCGIFLNCVKHYAGPLKGYIDSAAEPKSAWRAAAEQENWDQEESAKYDGDD